MAAGNVARKALLALVVVLIIALFSGFFWLHSLGTYLVQAEQPVKSDVILVLGGDWTGERVLTAAKLAQRGFAPKVWVSGPQQLYGVNEAELAINYAVQHGFPRSLFEMKVLPATSTREEAQDFKKEFERAGIHRILLVTSNFHTRRAGSIFRRELGPQFQVHVASAPYDRFHPDTWWKSREDQKTWLLEWSKTVADALRL